MHAFVFVTIGNPTSLVGLRDALQLIPGVSQMYFLTGPVHVLILLQASDNAELLERLSRIRHVGGVISADLNMILTV